LSCSFRFSMQKAMISQDFPSGFRLNRALGNVAK